jgi:hypothetical protein
LFFHLSSLMEAKLRVKTAEAVPPSALTSIDRAARRSGLNGRPEPR